MKKYLILFVFAVLSAWMLYVIGCSPKGTPIYTTLSSTFTPTKTLTLAPTSTQTSTMTVTNSPTITNTPNGTQTSTPTMTLTSTMTMTTTPTSGSTPFVLYANGGIYNFGSIVTNTGVFNDGVSPSPGLNAATSNAGGACCGDTMGYQVTFSSLPGNGSNGTYAGMQLLPTSGTANMTGVSTCTFYAQASQSCDVGFNAAESNSDYNNVGESLTTSWQQITLNIGNASRSDTFSGGAINSVTSYFILLISSSYVAGNTGGYTGTFPVTISFDQVSFQ